MLYFLGFSANVESVDAELSDYYLHCKGNQVAFGTLSASSCDTISIVFSFRPIDDTVSSVQTLFVVSPSAPVFIVEYIPMNSSLNFKTGSSGQSASTSINAVSTSIFFNLNLLC